MTHLSLSNIPIMRRHVSALKCVQLLFNKACCNSAEVIEPELSRSTAFERKKVETQLTIQLHENSYKEFYSLRKCK